MHISNDLYQTFGDKDFKYNYIYAFDKRNKDYLVPNNEAKYRWSYGDPVSLVFIFEDLLNTLDNVDVNDYHWNASSNPSTTIVIPVTNTVWNKATEDITVDINFIFTFYNFRFEEVFQTEVSLSDETAVIIDEDTSASTFLKGVYYCKVQAIYDDGKKLTIVPPEDCLIYVE